MRKVKLLALTFVLSPLAGCGEAERPRFVPAAPGAAREAPREPTRPSREVAIPRNIETH